MHDEIGGQLFVRSSWEDDAEWVGFFGGQLQLFRDGGVTRVDPKAAREPLDIDAAIVFFARESKQFLVPHAVAVKEAAVNEEKDAKENDATVFIVGLDAAARLSRRDRRRRDDRRDGRSRRNRFSPLVPPEASG